MSTVGTRRHLNAVPAAERTERDHNLQCTSVSYLTVCMPDQPYTLDTCEGDVVSGCAPLAQQRD